jgi:hypothetical protein
MPKGVYIRKPNNQVGKFKRTEEHREMARRQWQDKALREKRIEGIKNHLPSTAYKKGISNNVMDKHPMWKGGRKKTSYGYIWIRLTKHPFANAVGYVPEHRLVVENFIGRYLKPEEVIHHIDFNKTNNSINNLMIFKSNSEHAKWHVKLKQHGLTNPMRRQITFRWKEYKQPKIEEKEISINELEEYTGFSKPIWFELNEQNEQSKNNNA